MTLQAAINELRLVIRQQNLYDDDQLDDRLLKDWVINERSVWIRNEINKNRSADEQIIQTIGCLPLEVADKTSCPAYLTGYNLLQSSKDIPKTIELKNSDGIIEIGYVDKMAYPTSYVSLERFRFSGKGKWNQNIIFVTRYGQRLLVMSRGPQSYAKYLRYLRVRLLADDPEELANFTHVNGDACYSDEDEFPLNRWMWKYMREEILRVNFKELISAPTDKVNDSTETLKVATDGNS